MIRKRPAVLAAAICVSVLFNPALLLAAQDDQPNPVQIARGAKAWAENCGRCHNLRDPKEFSDKNWDVIVNHMRVIAPLPGQVARDIKVFLKSSN